MFTRVPVSRRLSVVCFLCASARGSLFHRIASPEMVDLSSPPLGDVHFGDSILSFLVEGEKVQDERHCMRVTSVLKFLWAGIASAASAIGEYGSGWRCPFTFYPLSFCENNNRKPSKNPITSLCCRLQQHSTYLQQHCCLPDESPVCLLHTPEVRCFISDVMPGNVVNMKQWTLCCVTRDMCRSHCALWLAASKRREMVADRRSTCDCYPVTSLSETAPCEIISHERGHYFVLGVDSAGAPLLYQAGRPAGILCSITLLGTYCWAGN